MEDKDLKKKSAEILCFMVLDQRRVEGAAYQRDCVRTQDIFPKLEA